MRVIFPKFPLLSKIQTLSHQLLVRQTSNHHHCNWHAQKPTCRDFKVTLSSSSWSKTNLFVYFERTNIASKLPALKIVESAHMPELKKTKDVLLKTKDGVLKTEDILLKARQSKCEQKIANTHPNIHKTYKHLTWTISISLAYGWA